MAGGRHRDYFGGVVVPCDHEAVKHSTAVSRLEFVAEELSRAAGWPDMVIVEAYFFGDLLDGREEIDGIQLAFALDMSPDEVPWRARPPRAEALTSILRFDKYPLTWVWRPASWPIWNAQIKRAVRFWTLEAGSDQSTLAALADRAFARLRFDAPPDANSLAAQLDREHEVGYRHLADVVGQYHDRSWRAAHKTFGVYPEDHLWWAAAGFLETDSAAREA